MPTKRAQDRRITSQFIAIFALLTSAEGFGACDAISSAAIATVSQGCSQEDIPAVVVRVSQPNASFDSAAKSTLVIEIIGIADIYSQGTNRSLVLSPLRRDVAHLAEPFARAALEAAAGHRVWLTGIINIHRLVRGQVIVADYDFRLPSGERLAGGLHALWQGNNSACG